MDDCDWLLSVEKACDWLRIEPGVTVNFFLGHPVSMNFCILHSVHSSSSYSFTIFRVLFYLKDLKDFFDFRL